MRLLVKYAAAEAFQSVPWSLSRAAYTNVSFSVAAQSGTPEDVAFKTDGTKVYVLDNIGSVFQYSLSPAWNISTASYDSVSFSVAAEETIPQGLAFKSDGTKMYVVGKGSDTVYQYSLTAWDLSTASYDSVSFSVLTEEANPTSLAFKSDGTKMYVVGISGDKVFQYSLSTAWNISTASYDSVSFSVAGQDSEPTGLALKSNGTKMYVVGNSSDTVYQYSL